MSAERFLVIQRDQAGTRFRVIDVCKSRELANAAARDCRGLVLAAVSFEDEEGREERRREDAE